jgi:hypothetical protein
MKINRKRFIFIVRGEAPASWVLTPEFLRALRASLSLPHLDHIFIPRGEAPASWVLTPGVF